MAIKQKLQWISKSFVHETNKGNSVFSISGVVLDTIVKTIEPPFYLYDTATIKGRYLDLQDALAQHAIDVYYAVKPNTSLAILDGLFKLGAGFDVGSEGELLAVAKIGADPKRVSFAGPVKTDEAIAYAIDFGIGIIYAESEAELQRINNIAKRKGKKQQVGIRVNINQQETDTTGLVMAGNASKFGIDEDFIDGDFIKQIQALAYIDLVGLHVYSGNMLDKHTLLANIENICRLAQKLNQFFTVRYLDFGGGLAVPYAVSEKDISLSELSRGIGKIFRRFPFLKKNKTKLCVEPGRFILAQSGIYIARVEEVKESHGRKIVLVDGGIQHMLRPSLLGSYHPIYNLSRLEEMREERVDIGGALCTPIDYLGKDVSLAVDTQRGDLLGIFVAGAYGWSEAMPYFMSNKTAAEVLVGNGKFSVIRKAEDPKIFLKKQIMPKENLF